MIRNIGDIIEVCDTAASTGEYDAGDLTEALELLANLLEPIKDFIEEIGTDWEDYPMEYFSRNKNARFAALEAFSAILENIEDYV
jgi:hypothetical protein